MTIHSDLEKENSFAKLNFNFADNKSRLQFFKVKICLKYNTKNINKMII